MRKARLEAQRDGNDNFIMPLLVGLNCHDVDFELAYSTENDTFSRLAEMYRSQVEAVQNQRPRVQAEIDAVSDQIVKQKEHLGIRQRHLADLETLFNKGLLRKEVLLIEQIQRTLVEGQLSTLEAQVARLRQVMGELEIRLGDVKAGYLRQTLTELQDTSQRLRDVENSIGPARRLLNVKAQGASGDVGDPEYAIRISRVRDGVMITVDATEDTMLSPGDVVEVKLKRRVSARGAGRGTRAVDRGSSRGPGSDLIHRRGHPARFQVSRRSAWLQETTGVKAGERIARSQPSWSGLQPSLPKSGATCASISSAAALYMIIFDHIPGDPLSKFTYTRLGFSDAAEIFVFLSGVSCGIVYSRLLARQVVSGLLRGVSWRALQIYTYYLIASLATILLIVLSRDVIAIPDNHQSFIVLREDPLGAIRSAFFSWFRHQICPAFWCSDLELTIFSFVPCLSSSPAWSSAGGVRVSGGLWLWLSLFLSASAPR